MPREYVLLSPEMPSDAVFRAAAMSLAVDGGPVSLTLDAGGLLARFHTEALDPVLTVLHPRKVPGLSELSRILPGLEQLPLPAESLWWSDVVVPWGGAQDPGALLAEAIARELGGRLVDSSALPGD
ncbi:hypothetical protein [Frondihabitans sp. VKM Ac-2883]|uniref:hypothetical protein n=1 Tax=Frondihabitans sp. VKM Ac-2883 TaxID=2783823 RepID=UPI00188D4CA4|nr:hypothetical protein [Frondihabitans sp. VKM Ac-2883]MBF4577764.1 hypothetical protein [Frondihabitans sp. VKM Ac-2883]